MIVMAKDYFGMPLKRIAIESVKSLIYIRNPNTQDKNVFSVGFPSTDVFVFDEQLYSQLCAEWQAEGRTKAATWGMAKLYNAVRYKPVA